ncbi:MAG: outer membrane beta-barrel protein [Verrucomicrobiota bacterium]|nr:outer membrane beta-barrel protein [Verrucomicrobiota bacterium]
MVRKLTHSRFFLAATGLIGLTNSSQALQPSDFLLFSRGSLSLRPLAELSETYNDNIYYRENNRVDDFVTVFTPGLKLQLGRVDGNVLAFTYRHDEVFYLQEDQQNTRQERMNFLATIQQGKFEIRGTDSWDRLSGIVGGGFSSGGQQLDRWIFNDNWTIRYGVTEKTRVYVEGTHNTVDFDEGEPFFDSNTLIGTVGFEMQPFSRTSFFGEIYYGQTATDPNLSTFPKPPHAEFIGAFLGARGNFTERLVGTVKAGYEHREFSGNSGTSDAPVVEVNLTQSFTERSIASLTYSRRQQVSIQFARSGYVSDAVNLTYRQQLGNTGRLWGTLGTLYERHDYDPTTLFAQRTDELMGLNANITYRFETWLTGVAAYNFEYFQSDLPAVIDYHANRVTLSVAVGY